MKKGLFKVMAKKHLTGESFDYRKRLYKSEAAKKDVKMNAKISEFLNSVTKRESAKVTAAKSNSLKFNKKKGNVQKISEDGFVRLRKKATLARIKQELMESMMEIERHMQKQRSSLYQIEKKGSPEKKAEKMSRDRGKKSADKGHNCDS